LPSHLAGFIASVREHTDLHLAVGFGIGTPGQAKAVGKLADGVVVGSALVREAGQPEPRQRVFNLAVSLARAAHGEATD
jgi:tryptophan synthase alpha chain